jgi:hypothetical protein
MKQQKVNNTQKKTFYNSVKNPRENEGWKNARKIYSSNKMTGQSYKISPRNYVFILGSAYIYFDTVMLFNY